MHSPRERLIAILTLAYSGELAAALAYHGHWKSTRDADTRRRIQAIEEEELHHRALVGRILAELGATPEPSRERRARFIGKTIGVLCHLSGQFAPLYGAGKLERRNIVEYEVAARHARDAGVAEYVDCILTMAEVEWEHERFFREQVRRHWLARLIPLWSPPPPKEEIRASFAREAHDEA